MLTHLPLTLAIITLIACALSALSAVFANRRNPAPAGEQLSGGLAYGLAIGAAIVALCNVIAQYMFGS